MKLIALILAATLAAGARAGMTVGVNIASVADFGVSAPYADALAMFRQPSTPSDPYNPSVLPLDAAGVPTVPFSTVGFLTNYAAGTYTLTYTGGGTVTARNAAILGGNVTEGVHTLTLQIDPAAASQAGGVVLTFNPNGPLSNVHLWSPGTRPGDVFTSQYLHQLSIFNGPLRTADLTLTNTPTETDWSTRPNPASPWRTTLSPGTAGATGAPAYPWEDAIALANATHRDLYVNVPATATPQYVASLGSLLKANLDPSLKVYAAWANETWNANAQQGAAIDAAAASDPRLPHADKWSDRARETAVKSADVTQAFARAGVNVVGVYEGWDANSWWSGQGVEQLKATFGPSLGGIKQLAVAPYPGNPYDAPNLNANSTPDEVFATLYANLATERQRLTDNGKVASDAGLALTTYEGGQSLVGLSESIQDDPRMGVFYTDYLNTLQDAGVVNAELFNDNSPYSQWGAWGVRDGLGDTVKSLAIAAFTAPDPSLALALLAVPLLSRRRKAA